MTMNEDKIKIDLSPYIEGETLEFPPRLDNTLEPPIDYADERKKELFIPLVDGKQAIKRKITNIVVSNICFSRCIFKYLDSEYATFRDCEFKECMFDDVFISNVRFERSKIEFDTQKIFFQTCNFNFCNITNSNIKSCIFKEENLGMISFKRSRLIDCNFGKFNAQVKQTTFDFTEAHLCGTIDKGMTIEGCKFSGTDLSGAKFNNSHCCKALFDKDVFLKDVDLSDACFCNTTIRTHICNATSQKTSFHKANLQDATFSVSPHSRSNFKNCSLNITDYNDSLLEQDRELSPIVFNQRATKQRLFLSYGYDDINNDGSSKKASEIREKINNDSNLTTRFSVSDGTHLETSQLSEDVLSLIRRCDVLFAIIAKRNDRKKHVWVLQEIAAAKGLQKRIIILMDKRLKSQCAPFTKNLLADQFVHYYDGNSSAREVEGWDLMKEIALSQLNDFHFSNESIYL